MLDGFSERFLSVNAVRERFVIDRDRITCGGAMTAFDLMLTLIGTLRTAVKSAGVDPALGRELDAQLNAIRGMVR